MALDSLDPRINRWNLSLKKKDDYGSTALDQLPTYEVFLQMKEGRAYEHVGIVHAATPDMAFLFAKEQFSRRYTCTGMWVVPSDLVMVSDVTESEENIYDLVAEPSNQEAGPDESFEIFHLYKRGKQHKHAGQVEAGSHHHAIVKAKQEFDDGKPVFNIWLAKTADIVATDKEDQVIWSTLKEKVHREVISYKAGDKLKAFKEKRNDHRQ